jgi:hypothetical protein
LSHTSRVSIEAEWRLHLSKRVVPPRRPADSERVEAFKPISMNFKSARVKIGVDADRELVAMAPSVRSGASRSSSDWM